MPVNLSIKNVPEAMAAKLRERAQRNHRSLQGELMAILENAAIEPKVVRANAGGARYEIEASAAPADGLLDRLMAIAGDRGIDTTKRLTREQAHDRKLLRKAGV
jgi:plasmid stability protein